MDFIEGLRDLSTKIEEEKDIVQDEATVKSAFVMPFISLLGYKVSDPREVKPEFTADVGAKQGEKVDYAIFKDDEVIMLIECKKYGTDLSDTHHTTQLYRYFSGVHARIAVLTDGVLYRFYTDLEESNKMDTKPFLEFNMLDIQQQWVNELKRFTKSVFDLEAILAAAENLKYTKEIKQIMVEQLEAPSEDFIRFFLHYVYSRQKTQAVVQKFTDIVKRSFNQFLNEQINQRSQSAIEGGKTSEELVEVEASDESVAEEVEPPIVTKDLERKIKPKNCPDPSNRKQCLFVVMPNGDEINHKVSAITFVEVIERLGIERVRSLNKGGTIPLISTHKHEKDYQRQSGRYYVMTHSSTKRKKILLEKIAADLREPLKVEIVDYPKI